MSKKSIILSIVTIAWLAMIFIFSNQKSYESTNLSDSFINKTIINVYELFHGELKDDEALFVKTVVVFPVRKLAHFTIYFILGILVFLTFKSYGFSNLISLSIIFCFVYACSDEFHQLFIEGRSGEIRDIILDSLGSTLGVFLLNLKNSKKIF